MFTPHCKKSKHFSCDFFYLFNGRQSDNTNRQTGMNSISLNIWKEIQDPRRIKLILFLDLENLWIESGWYLQHSYRNADVVDLSRKATYAILNGFKSYQARF